jgi:hypothetical protein
MVCFHRKFQIPVAVAPYLPLSHRRLQKKFARPPYWYFTYHTNVFFPHDKTASSRPEPSHCRGFVITSRHTTFGRTPLDDGLARSRDLYLTTHNTQDRQTSLSPAEFEPSVPASERPQTLISDRTETGMTPHEYTLTKFRNCRRCVSLIVRNLMKLIKCNFRRFNFTNSRVCHFVSALWKIKYCDTGATPNGMSKIA